jgi:drug/metabolite transporter (DMT)-like permease
MVSLVLAVLAAAVWGTADFCGGRASRRVPALTVSVVSKVAALPALALALPAAGGHPTAAALGWGATAGVFGMAGVILLYRGLAAGVMSVVAPVTAVTAALVPFALGVLLDGAPRGTAIVGAMCAVAAIALVSAGHASAPRAGRAAGSGAGLALAAGLGFGLFMTFLSRARGTGGAGTGLWPLLPAQLVSIALGAALLRRSRGPVRVTGTALRWTLVAGLLDFAANVLYVLAARRGQLSVVGPVSSLYPASTVLLALAVDRERVRAVQLAGLGLAAVALVLVGS